MFSPEIINTFWSAAEVTVKGMTGIFIFMAVFFAVIKLLDKMFPQKLNKTSNS